MPTSTTDSRKPYARLSPEAKVRVIAELKRLNDSGALASQPPPPVKGPVKGSYMTLRERAAQNREEA